MKQLQPFAENIWTVTAPQRFHGIEIGTRMTVVKLPDGQLWIHSPVNPTANMLTELRQQGPVAYIVAPNRLHHLYIEPFRQHFPEAKTYLAPKLGKKLKRENPEFTFDQALSSASPEEWLAAFEQQVIEGIPRFQEVVFHHKASKTLIVTDAIYDLGSAPSWLTKALALLFRKNRPGALFNDSLIRMVKDDQKVAKSLKKIAVWDFKHVIMAHGEAIRDEGRERFLDIYGNLLRAS